MRVAIFTDNDFDKTNGVTTTLRAVLRHLPDDVHARIYTASELCSDGPDYLALAAFGVPIPWYGEMRMYAPPLRDFRRHLAADDIGLVHITTPGPVGLAAKHLAEDCLRTLAQRRQVAGRNERVPALRLCPACRRRSGADPAQEHPLNLAEKSLSG